MDDLLPKLALAALALAASGIAAAQPNAKSLPIEVVAESSSIDGQSNLVHFRGLKITQGGLSIEAGDALANGVDFEDSEWRFSGGVRIVVDSAVVESDSAVFKFRAHQLQRGDFVGAPASFTDRKPTRKETARGSANKITYNNVARTLQMSENARIVRGSSEIIGCELIYDFAEARVTSGSSGCPVRYIVHQSEDSDADPASNP